MSVLSQDCYCALNCHKRYDYPLARANDPPGYGKNLKTMYGKDYVRQPSDRTLQKPYGDDLALYGSRGTPKKIPSLPGQFHTNYKDDYVPKKTRDTRGDAE